MTTFGTKPLFFHHSGNEVRKLEYISSLVIFTVFMQPIRHMHQGVESHHINRPKSSRFWSSNYRSGKLVDFLYGQPHILDLMEETLNTKNTNSISNKCWRVFGKNRTFAEECTAIIHQKRTDFGQAIWAWYDLKKF